MTMRIVYFIACIIALFIPSCQWEVFYEKDDIKATVNQDGFGIGISKPASGKAQK